VFKARDNIAHVMVMPADGPSFGVAPSGKCKWILFLSRMLWSMWLSLN